MSGRYAWASPREEKRPQLFDLFADPHENRYLASSHPEVVARLARRLEQWWPTPQRKVLTQWTD